jgi:hypothetical protein
MSCAGERLCRQLVERGCRVTITPVASFLRRGGSAFCLTLRLDRQSASVCAAVRAAVARDFALSPSSQNALGLLQ